MATQILYIVSTLRDSGPTNQLYYLIDNLDDEFDATILTLSPEPEDSELPRFQELDVEYTTLGLSRLKGTIHGPSKLRSAVNQHDPDVIHTQGIRADTLSALFLSNYSRVTTIRNYAYDDYPAKYGRIQGKAMGWTHLRALQRLDYPVACSETISGLVADHGINAKPIQNGVDTKTFTPADEETQRQKRDELGLPQSKQIIVSVGSLIPRKEPETAIRGFLSSEIVNESLLVFLGDGFRREACETLVSGSDPIQFEGWVDNVVDYLHAADYFVSASNSEGLPNSVMEALAVGLPVCLSDIEPHQEILRLNEQIGTQFTCGSSNDLASSLEELVSKGYRFQSEQAVSTANKKLSATRMAADYQQFYTGILSGDLRNELSW